MLVKLLLFRHKRFPSLSRIIFLRRWFVRFIGRQRGWAVHGATDLKSRGPRLKFRSDHYSWSCFSVAPSFFCVLHKSRKQKKEAKQIHGFNKKRAPWKENLDLAVNWWFACDVMAAMLVYRDNKIFLLWGLTAIFMQTMWTNFLLFCTPTWRQCKPPIGFTAL